MNDALRSEMRRLSERASEEGMQSPPSRCQALHKARVHHLQLLIQRLEEVLTAAQALDHFMATVREVKAEIPTLVANQPPGRQPLEAEWEQETDSWQATMQRKLLTVDSVDSSLKAAGMTLTMDGARVTCWDVLTSLSQQAVNVEEEVGRGNKRERKDDFYTAGREKIQAFNPMEEEGGLVAKRSKPERDDDRISQRHAEHKAQTRKLDENDLTGEERRGRSIQVKKEGEETESSVQRRVALSGTLKAIREAAEQLRLQEPTLPALQHRYNTYLHPKYVFSTNFSSPHQPVIIPAGMQKQSQSKLKHKYINDCFSLLQDTCIGRATQSTH